MKAAYERRLVNVVVDGSVSRVRGWHAHRLAVEAGLRPVFVAGMWTFDTGRLADYVAHLEYRNIAFKVEDTEVDRDRDVHRGDDQLDVGDAELPLFDLGSR